MLQMALKHRQSNTNYQFHFIVMTAFHLVLHPTCLSLYLDFILNLQSRPACLVLFTVFAFKYICGPTRKCDALLVYIFKSYVLFMVLLTDRRGLSQCVCSNALVHTAKC